MNNANSAKLISSNLDRMDLIGEPARVSGYRTTAAFLFDLSAGVWILAIAIVCASTTDYIGPRLATLNFVLYSFGAIIPLGFARVIESLAESNQRTAELTSILVSQSRSK